MPTVPGSYPIHTEVHPMASQHAIFVEDPMPPRRCSMRIDTHKTHPRSEGNECVIFSILTVISELGDKVQLEQAFILNSMSKSRIFE